MKVTIYGRAKQWPGEDFAIVNTDKNYIVQFDSAHRAYENCGQLNKHEFNNGRAQVYRVIAVKDLEIGDLVK